MKLIEEDRGTRRYLADDGVTVHEVKAEMYGYFAIMERAAAEQLGHLIHPGLDEFVMKHLAYNEYEPRGEIRHSLEEPFLVFDGDGNLLGPMCRVISEIGFWPHPPDEPAIDFDLV